MMTLYECLNCGHKWESRAKRPQCPKCKRYRAKPVNDENDELKDEQQDENQQDDESEDENQEQEKKDDKIKPEEDLYKDVKGEVIKEKPRKTEKKPKKEKKEKDGFKAVNLILIIGAIAAIGLAVWWWLFKPKTPEDEKKQGGEISPAWIETLRMR